MTTLAKIIVATIISLSLFSCNFDMNLNSGKTGNGNVTIENRTVTQPFTSIKATEGLEVYVTQSDTESIRVEADANLQDLIITEVVDDVLKIHTKQNIGNCKAKKVMVNFKTISGLEATSGSNLRSVNTLIINDLSIETSSGSHVNLSINTTNLDVNSSSGSYLKLTGKTNTFNTESSSGSSVSAEDFEAQTTYAKASSGANITINTLKTLHAKAGSGGSISFLGNPEKVTKNASASGSINKL